MPSESWNRRVYRAWAPVYDPLLERVFRPGRTAAIARLDLQPGERVVLVGIGTGLDLPLLPRQVEVTGIDISPAMLARARDRARALHLDVDLREGDAAHTGLPSGGHDAVVLHLVLSVVPDPRAVLREAMRLLRPGGRAVVFDKFAPDGRPVSRPRRAASVVTGFFGTEIDRRLADIVAGARCQVVKDEPSILRGQYRVVLLERDPAGATI